MNKTRTKSSFRGYSLKISRETVTAGLDHGDSGVHCSSRIHVNRLIGPVARVIASRKWPRHTKQT